jgi:toxin FitB
VTGFLLDTNVWSELRKGTRASPHVLAWIERIPPEQLFVSVLVLGEIRSGIERVRARDARQAVSLERWLFETERFYGDQVLPVTAAIADLWGKFNAASPIAVVDGLMAATASHYKLTLVTRNVNDVKKTGVDLLDPFRGNN